MNNFKPMNQEMNKWQLLGKIKFAKTDSTMSRLMTINEATTQINSQTQLILQVISIKKIRDR